MRTRTMRALGMLAMLQGCATQRAAAPVDAASSTARLTSEAPAEGAASQLAELERVAAVLDEAYVCRDTGGLEAAPAWAILGPSVAPRVTEPIRPLVELATNASSPRLRALALLWLGSVGGPDAIEAIDAIDLIMADTAAAGTATTAAELYGLTGDDAGLVLAVGAAGTIVRPEDHGRSWCELVGPTTVDLAAAWRSPGGTLFAAGPGRWGQCGARLPTLTGGQRATSAHDAG